MRLKDKIILDYIATLSDKEAIEAIKNMEETLDKAIESLG